MIKQKRLPRDMSFTLRLVAGACPSCAMFVPGMGVNGHAVIYRRSPRSVTFRCERCKLQWTMTWANLYRCASAKSITPGEGDEGVFYSNVAQWTKKAASVETRGRKRR